MCRKSFDSAVDSDGEGEEADGVVVASSRARLNSGIRVVSEYPRCRSRW